MYLFECANQHPREKWFGEYATDVCAKCEETCAGTLINISKMEIDTELHERDFASTSNTCDFIPLGGDTDNEEELVLLEPEPVHPNDCCPGLRDFIRTLRDQSGQPLGEMIRTVYEAAIAGRLMHKSDTKGGDHLKMRKKAFDITFLWHAAVLADCKAFAGYDQTFMSTTWLLRPTTNEVDVCHDTAMELTRLIGLNPGEVLGWLGTNQSHQTEMKIHQDNCAMLCTNLTFGDRCICHVSHCGHSFCLLKRRRHGPIEIIDAFAHDRGLGLWALSPTEVDCKGWSEKHLPPRLRIRGLAEVCKILKKMVDDDYEKRVAAQMDLLNYPFEEPDENHVDRLPLGVFGFRRWELAEDDEILAAVAEKLYCAFNHWQPYAAKFKKPSRSLLRLGGN